mgnify:CR=1 FL=1
MGREARIVKDRTCEHCQEVLYDVSTEYLKRHAEDCQRMQRAGLVMPTIVGRKDLIHEL